MSAKPCQGSVSMSRPVSMAQAATCGQTPTALYRLGCVHEHFGERWLCADCSEPHGDINYCGFCFTIDGHLCNVLITPAGVAHGGAM